ncbi:hypothetical protein AAGG52_07740 [Bacillus licheniformis]
MDHMQFVSAVQKAGVDAKELKYITAQDGAGMSMVLGKKPTSTRRVSEKRPNRRAPEKSECWLSPLPSV